MRVSILRSRAEIGISAPPVTIEVSLSGGLPRFSIVGMPETAVRESKDRVRAAIESCGFKFPQQRITVSLGPADMRKRGGRYDLGIALGILISSRQINDCCAPGTEFYGELALNGELRAIPGVLPAALRAASEGVELIVPSANLDEACLARTTIFGATSLAVAAAHVTGNERIAEAERNNRCTRELKFTPDLADVRGQPLARRALEIAAAGGHNILFCGPPGTGKSMLAQRLPGILPPPSYAESVETAAVESLLGIQANLVRWQQRPFRSPHHTASAIAIVGGGSNPRPGEISRAHNGVLFLDELPEFSRHVLEVLREPIETGRVVVSRASAQVEFPSRFQLVAAMNPCPCGFLGDAQADCHCSADRVSRYRARLSGPLLDRIDIQALVPRPSKEALRPDAEPGEPSASVLRRVVAARDIQLRRSGCSNHLLQGDALHSVCELDCRSWTLLEQAMDRFAMSARAQQRVLRVSRTIADLDGDQHLAERHVVEALSLRCLDRPAAALS